jgi:hypothetical protein
MGYGDVPVGRVRRMARAGLDLARLSRLRGDPGGAQSNVDEALMREAAAVTDEGYAAFAAAGSAELCAAAVRRAIDAADGLGLMTRMAKLDVMAAEEAAALPPATPAPRAYSAGEVRGCC